MVILYSKRIYCDMEINGKLIHFTGIGGVSMSALACFAILNGAYVTGSDQNTIINKSYLDNLGIISYIGSNPSIAENADILVYTSAVDEKDKEVRRCREKGIITLARHEFLSMVAQSYRDVIAISGAHGKTTTTAMLSAILRKADYPYAAHVGGHSYDIGGNFYHKGNELFVTEACEYKRSFLSLKPTLSVILNIDHDHPDTYKTKEDMVKAFEQFSNNASITLAYQEFVSYVPKNEHIITFGLDNTSDFYTSNISMYQDEKYKMDICVHEHILIEGIYLPVYGAYNILNALAAAAAAAMWGIPPETIKKGLNEYKGVGRRFEIKGKFKDALIISDYAHHPEEIKATIKTAKKMTKGRLIVIFEPHTFSRTKALIEEFATCFMGADKLIILPTYAAREYQGNGMDSHDLLSHIEEKGVLSADDYYQAREMALSDIASGDTILVVGAGTVVKLADMLCEYNK